jgi:hypothetical protein
MSVDNLAKLVAIVAAVIGVINLIWTWHNQAQLPGKAALTDLDGKVDDHDRRLLAVEGELRHLPTKADLQKVELSIERMLGEMRVVQTELKGSGRTLQRLEDHLRGERA